MDELVVKQDDFAGDWFWRSANRLADQAGHAEHVRYLAGTAADLDRYALHCERCDDVVARFIIDRS